MGRLRRALGDAQGREGASLAGAYVSRLSSSARSVSDWELTETYSPARPWIWPRPQARQLRQAKRLI